MSAPQILPSLLFLAFGGVGLLWLSEPSPVGAAQRERARAARAPQEDARPAARLAAPTRLPEVRWPAERSARQAPSAAPAQAFGPEALAQLQQRIAAGKERERQERLRARERAQDAWFSERAAQLAAELALPAGAAEQLADLYVEERDRQTAAWELARAKETREASRAALREEMRAVFAWRAAELERRFGADDAARIVAAENADVAEE